MPATSKPSQRASDTTKVLGDAGQRPVLDLALDRVLADCPVCDAGASDPVGLYRPLVVGCFSRDQDAPVRMLCTAYGCQPDRIRAALNEPPVDWQAIASEYEALLADAVAQLDAALHAHRTPLAVAA